MSDDIYYINNIYDLNTSPIFFNKVNYRIDSDLLNKKIAVDGLDHDLTVTKTPLSAFESCFGNSNKGVFINESKWELISETTLVFRIITTDTITYTEIITDIVFEISPNYATFTRLIRNDKELNKSQRANFYRTYVRQCYLANPTNLESEPNALDLDIVNILFDDCAVFIDSDFPGYQLVDYIEIALKVYNIDNSISRIYNVKETEKSPYAGAYIQFIKNTKYIGFLVRQFTGNGIVKNDIILNGMICGEIDTISGTTCYNPIIIQDNKKQNLDNALKYNKIFIEIVKILKGWNWNEVN
jgi:hypothetical protein